MILPYSSRSAEIEAPPETDESPLVVSSTPVTQPSNQLESWIAIPIALSDPINANQVQLPPGPYRIKIKIDWEKGDGIEKEYDIVITSNGQHNSLNERA